MTTNERLPATDLATKEEHWTAWELHAHKLLRAAMRENKVSYKQLSTLLESLGINEMPDVLNRKVSRRKFSAAFYLACMEAINAKKAGPAAVRPALKAIPKQAENDLLAGWPPRNAT